MNKLSCDVLIFGSGIIGTSLALRLSQSGINVIIIDNKYLSKIVKKNTIPHTRVAAINYSSIEFLKKINVWMKIPPNFYESYHRLETWEWPSSKVIFCSTLLGLPNMGCIVENNRLQFALWNECIRSRIKLYFPYILISIHYNGIYWKCVFNNGLIIINRLLIGADGAYSQIRKHLDIKTTYWKYHQHCMLLTVKTEKYMFGTVWQIFTPSGPIGFLPLYNHWGLLMWYGTPKKICDLKTLSILTLEQKIKKKLGTQLGNNIKLYNREITSLIYQRAHNYIAPGGALIGDAAHVIHPLAGQGINLGIRDVISLSELLINSRIFDENSNESMLELLINYQNNRQCDSFFMQTGTNWLHTIFNNNSIPIKIARNAVFMIVEHSCYLKKKILQYAVGI